MCNVCVRVTCLFVEGSTQCVCLGQEGEGRGRGGGGGGEEGGGGGRVNPNDNPGNPLLDQAGDFSKYIYISVVTGFLAN